MPRQRLKVIDLHLRVERIEKLLRSIIGNRRSLSQAHRKLRDLFPSTSSAIRQLFAYAGFWLIMLTRVGLKAK